MKKYSSPLLPALLSLFILTLTACKKFLTEEPATALSETAAFSNIYNARSTVLGAYNRLASGSCFGLNLSLVYPYDDGDMVQYINANVPDGGARDISRYALTQSNASLGGAFTRLYSGIERANICIKNIPNMPEFISGKGSDSVEAKRLYGEALTIRAICYTELVKHWGDVPVQWKPSIDMENLNTPKTDRDSIFDRLLADLKTAEDMVPWRGISGAGSDERFTKGGIKALRARIALYRGGYALRRATTTMERRPDYMKYYQIARDECNDVMQSGKHSLNATYSGIFKDAILAHKVEPNGEVLMEIAMGASVADAESSLGNFDGPPVNNYGNKRVMLLPTYFYSFDSVDTRRDITAAPYAVDGSGYKVAASVVSIYDGKFRRDWITNPSVALTTGGTYFGINWPIIRYSDVLLMFAEAENELNNGPTPAAVTAFETVRKRAYGTNASRIGITPTTYAPFFTALVKERSLELGGEGIRKYDLIRWNLLNQKILDTRAELTKMRLKQAPYTNLPQYIYYKSASDQSLYYNSFFLASPSSAPTGWSRVNWIVSLTDAYVQKVASNFQPNHSEVFPLPQVALESNYLLKQDYGY